MTYEQTPIKTSKGLGKKARLAALDELSTGAIMWLLVKRHKVTLISVWAVVMTLLYLCPFLPDLIRSMF